MDTSETYIKMCKKAEEIQKLWANIDFNSLPSFCYDEEMQRVCIFLWMPGRLKEKLQAIGNSMIVSTEWDRPLNHFTPVVEDWETKTAWLPRQDQLQEMVWDSERYQNKAELIGCVYHFTFPMCRYKVAVKELIVDDEDNPNLVTENILLNGEEVSYPKQFTSMEQLWLAFAMKEKYNKVWNGDEWTSG